MSTKAFFNGGLIVNNLNDIDLQTSTGNGVILKPHPDSNGTSKLILPYESPTDGSTSRVLRWNTSKLSELLTNSEIYMEFYDDVELAQNVSNGIVNVTATTGNLNLTSTSGNVVITPEGSFNNFVKFDLSGSALYFNSNLSFSSYNFGTETDSFYTSSLLSLYGSGGINLGAGSSKINVNSDAKFTKNIEYTCNTYSNLGSTSSGIRDAVDIGNVNVHFISDRTNFYYNMPAGADGQQLNIFFTNNGTGTANIAFISSNLYTGSGLADGLTFTTTGQSAQLMYFDLSGDTENDYAFSGWRIINTGATIF
jgi:hypothetical protein